MSRALKLAEMIAAKLGSPLVASDRYTRMRIWESEIPYDPGPYGGNRTTLSRVTVAAGVMTWHLTIDRGPGASLVYSDWSGKVSMRNRPTKQMVTTLVELLMEGMETGDEVG